MVVRIFPKDCPHVALRHLYQQCLCATVHQCYAKFRLSLPAQEACHKGSLYLLSVTQLNLLLVLPDVQLAHGFNLIQAPPVIQHYLLHILATVYSVCAELATPRFKPKLFNAFHGLTIVKYRYPLSLVHKIK
jgi:hypothetical protein